MTTTPTIALNDGRAIPQLGFGVWRIEDAQAPSIVGTALQAGYRLIDTAAIYGNERGIGRSLRETGLAREALFVTTKLWNDAQGYDETLRAFDESMAKLDCGILDLYLIHWPCPDKDAYLATWKALIALREQGRVRSIGVSNFTITTLERIIGETGVTPALNQIELHPGFQQHELHRVHAAHGIVTQAWSPLGQGQILANPAITAIATRHGKTPAQIVLRWHVENGIVAIPKSATPQRISENIAVFDFALSPEDRAAIDALDRRDGRIGPDPDTFC